MERRVSSRGGARKKARPDDARGGLRTTTRADAKPAGGRKTKWRSVFHADVQAALAVMGEVDAVRARMRQDEAEIALIERLVLEERDRRLNQPAPRSP